MLKTNKPYSLYGHPEGSYVVSLAASPDGKAIISGHLDGSIYRFTFPADEGGTWQYPCPLLPALLLGPTC